MWFSSGSIGNRVGRRPLLVAAVAALVAAVAIPVTVLVLAGDDREEERASGGPRAVSAQELRALAADSPDPVYWAGALPGTSLELTEVPRGRVFVRYLFGEAQPGDPRPAFTTVATYPRPRAYQEVVRATRRDGASSRPAPGGGLAVWRKERPTSVYLAVPAQDVLVEVFDPNARRARDLTLSGGVGPVR